MTPPVFLAPFIFLSLPPYHISTHSTFSNGLDGLVMLHLCSRICCVYLLALFPVTLPTLSIQCWPTLQFNWRFYNQTRLQHYLAVEILKELMGKSPKRAENILPFLSLLKQSEVDSFGCFRCRSQWMILRLLHM